MSNGGIQTEDIQKSLDALKQQPNLVDATRAEKLYAEILRTEQSYVEGLNQIGGVEIAAALAAYDAPGFVQKDNEYTKEELKNLFNALVQVRNFHVEMKKSLLEFQPDKWAQTLVFAENAHQQYVMAFQREFSGIKKKVPPAVNEAVVKISPSAQIAKDKNISSILITPVQRLPRYEMLAQQFVKITSGTLKEQFENLHQKSKEMATRIDSPVELTKAEVDYLASLKNRQVSFEAAKAKIAPLQKNYDKALKAAGPKITDEIIGSIKNMQDRQMQHYKEARNDQAEQVAQEIKIVMKNTKLTLKKFNSIEGERRLFEGAKDGLKNLALPPQATAFLDAIKGKAPAALSMQEAQTLRMLFQNENKAQLDTKLKRLTGEILTSEHEFQTGMILLSTKGQIHALLKTKVDDPQLSVAQKNSLQHIIQLCELSSSLVDKSQKFLASYKSQFTATAGEEASLKDLMKEMEKFTLLKESQNTAENIKALPADLQQKLFEITKGIGLDGLLIKPMQRALKYPMLFQELTKVAPTNSAVTGKPIKDWYEVIKNDAMAINTAKAVQSAQQAQVPKTAPVPPLSATVKQKPLKANDYVITVDNVLPPAQTNNKLNVTGKSKVEESLAAEKVPEPVVVPKNQTIEPKASQPAKSAPTKKINPNLINQRLILNEVIARRLLITDLTPKQIKSLHDHVITLPVPQRQFLIREDVTSQLMKKQVEICMQLGLYSKFQPQAKEAFLKEQQQAIKEGRKFAVEIPLTSDMESTLLIATDLIANQKIGIMLSSDITNHLKLKPGEPWAKNMPFFETQNNLLNQNLQNMNKKGATPAPISVSPTTNAASAASAIVSARLPSTGAQTFANTLGKLLTVKKDIANPVTMSQSKIVIDLDLVRDQDKSRTHFKDALTAAGIKYDGSNPRKISINCSEVKFTRDLVDTFKEAYKNTAGAARPPAVSLGFNQMKTPKTIEPQKIDKNTNRRVNK